MDSVFGSACLDHLQALILLDGSVRPNPFAAAIGRSLLNLPVDDNLTVLGHWREQAERFARTVRFDRLPMRVFIDRNAPEPKDLSLVERIPVEIDRDPVDFRGSGGLLRDIAVDYRDDDFLLVASGTQILQEAMTDVIQRLLSLRADVAMVAHRDGTPGGMTIVRCGVLRDISPIGYVDMKEQALPQIARQHEVRVAQWDDPIALPIRSPSTYLFALRRHHQRRGDVKATHFDPSFDEDWRPTFKLVEKGARAHPTAELLDSVVLAGATVGAGASVVRTVVCPDAMIPAGATIHGELYRD